MRGRCTWSLTFTRSAGLARNWPITPASMADGLDFLHTHTHTHTHTHRIMTYSSLGVKGALLPDGKASVLISAKDMLSNGLIERDSRWIHCIGNSTRISWCSETNSNGWPHPYTRVWRVLEGCLSTVSETPPLELQVRKQSVCIHLSHTDTQI